MNKHDTVIGYIEYLDCNGCVRERIPYVDAEKFKTRIYASLYCGEPIIPVLFPENLSQPLLFEKGTIFPWGLRRKKYELLPYEIYQTNNREIAFLRYDYTKDHINAASYKLVYRGQMECWQTLDSLYCLHNQENRPNGRKMRSLSVSDIMMSPPTAANTSPKKSAPRWATMSMKNPWKSPLPTTGRLCRFWRAPAPTNPPKCG